MHIKKKKKIQKKKEAKEKKNHQKKNHQKKFYVELRDDLILLRDTLAWFENWKHRCNR